MKSKKSESAASSSQKLQLSCLNAGHYRVHCAVYLHTMSQQILLAETKAPAEKPTAICHIEPVSTRACGENINILVSGGGRAVSSASLSTPRHGTVTHVTAGVTPSPEAAVSTARACVITAEPPNVQGD